MGNNNYLYFKKKKYKYYKIASLCEVIIREPDAGTMQARDPSFTPALCRYAFKI